ncbi:helix-turn-helix domain-containing protein [Burkholderia multivorans]|nr:helix-turn-helix domain-containing protein [Burkholderia multivorans]
MATAGNVVQLPAAQATPAEQAKQSEKKFGKAVASHGLFVAPALLLRAQARLNVNSTQMVVLLQLLDFWWAVDGSAHPSIATVAERIDLTPKQVQRTVNALVEKGLITRIHRTLPSGGKTSNQYKFDGLIVKLKQIEPDFEKVRKMKKAAGKPGGLTANKV